MTETSALPGVEKDQIPLSSTQELWCGWDESGAFGPRFIMSQALRLTGRIDVGALQAALNDVVERHEILRTIVVPNGNPPHQRIYAPSPVPLEVRDLVVPAGSSRDEIADELLFEAESSSLDVQDLPLLRAMLARFDERDSVLALVTHHTVGDGWSMQLIRRDLAAYYAARTAGQAPELAEVRQYQEYALWQHETRPDLDASPAFEYWRNQLKGAKLFTLPADRPVRTKHTSDYIAYRYAVPPDVVAATSALGTASRSSMFTILLAALNMLAHQITGTVDPVITTLTAGRGQRVYRETVGPFLNFLALRTNFGNATTFNDIVSRTRKTCLEAYSNEIPFGHIERGIPELMEPLTNPSNCDFVFGFNRPLFSSTKFQMAEGSSMVLPITPKSPQLPGGAAWTMGVGEAGQVLGMVQFNPGEFDEDTVSHWVSSYLRLLDCATAEPDREWKTF